MLVVLTETYCNKVNIKITQRDDFIQTTNCFPERMTKGSYLPGHEAVSTGKYLPKFQMTLKPQFLEQSRR